VLNALSFNNNRKAKVINLIVAILIWGYNVMFFFKETTKKATLWVAFACFLLLLN